MTFQQQCPARNKLPWATRHALKKKIGKFLHSVHFSPLVSLPTIWTIIRQVIKTGLKRGGFTVNSIKFALLVVNCLVGSIKMAKRQLRIKLFEALTTNNKTSDAV